jgi:hypothetical protein
MPYRSYHAKNISELSQNVQLHPKTSETFLKLFRENGNLEERYKFLQKVGEGTQAVINLYAPN